MEILLGSKLGTNRYSWFCILVSPPLGGDVPVFRVGDGSPGPIGIPLLL